LIITTSVKHVTIKQLINNNNQFYKIPQFSLRAHEP